MKPLVEGKTSSMGNIEAHQAELRCVTGLARHLVFDGTFLFDRGKN